MNHLRDLRHVSDIADLPGWQEELNRNIDDHGTVQAQRLSAIYVIVRVIELRAGLNGLELVAVQASVLDRLLRERSSGSSPMTLTPACDDAHWDTR